MKRLRLPLAALLAISSLAVIGSATTAEAATPSAVYSSVVPSRPMANEQFTASWHLSTHLNRYVRLQTISGGTWKTISERVSNGAEVGFAVHSSKTRDYRVYVPKTSRSGKAYPSFSSAAKTLHIFPQTVDAFASPLEQCGTEGERVPVILVAQFEPPARGPDCHVRGCGARIRVSDGDCQDGCSRQHRGLDPSARGSAQRVPEQDHRGTVRGFGREVRHCLLPQLGEPLLLVPVSLRSCGGGPSRRSDRVPSAGPVMPGRGWSGCSRADWAG